MEEAERLDPGLGLSEFIAQGGGGELEAGHLREVDALLENVMGGSWGPGGRARRVIVTMPPRMGKSTRVCWGVGRGVVTYPALMSCADQCYVRQVDGKYTLIGGARTPKGISYYGGDPIVIDRMVDEVEACLATVASSKCGKLPIDRSSFRVVIAPDYKTDSEGEQYLPVYAGMGCKGRDGKCYWRALLQPDRTIVTTPRMNVFKDPLVRMVWGVQEIWTNPALAKCATSE